MTSIALVALTALVHLAIVAVVLGPVIWWVARRTGRPALTQGAASTLVLAAAIYVAYVVVLALPRVGAFAELTWNWQGKALALLALVLLVATWPGLTWRDVGVTVPAPGWWRLVLAVLAGTVVLQLVTGPLGDLAPTPETFAFQATMPGLDEELMFRGVLLVLLDRALAARRSMWGGQVGWSALITTLLFGLGHGLFVREGPTLAFDPTSVVVTSIVGLVLLWVRIGAPRSCPRSWPTTASTSASSRSWP